MTPHLDQGQIDAVLKLENGCILCGEVGSGKSRTGLAYYFCKVCKGKINGRDRGYDQDYIPMKKPLDLYIITTARKRDQEEWDEELAPFLLSRNPEVSYYGDRVKVVVDSWNNIKKYIDISGAFFLFDEQRVVGSGTWSKSFIKIAKKNQWIFLTATPGDVWMDYVSIFIANGFYKNRRDFIDQHVVYSRYSKYPRVDRYMNEARLRMFRDSLLVNIEYRKPTERHIDILYMQYDRNAYRLVMNKRWNIYEEKPIENSSELCSVLRKITNSDPSRGAAVLDILKGHPRAIIFYNFNYELEILRNLPYDKDVSVAEWNGQKHEPLPMTEKWVYLVQYLAGAEGWNCTQTDTLIFYSQHYSYRATEQAMGRIDRRSTGYHDLYYFRLQSRAPIDIAIARALRQKKTFNESRFVSKSA